METYKIKLNVKKILKNCVNKNQQYTIPVFIPHLGCKNECVFCNQRKISGKNKILNLESVKKEIDEYLKYMKANVKIQIAFFGGSFTGIEIQDQIEYLKLANDYIKKGLVNSIRISTRPDYINIGILKILKKYNVENIELGIQSMDDDVLKKSKRGHTSNDVKKACKLIKMFGFKLGQQIMVGLPGSDVIKEINTIKKLLIYRPTDLRIYPVYVIKPSELYNMYLENEYTPLKLQDSIDRTHLIVKQCKKSNVKIIRLGLQSTCDITVNSKKILGPVCDNFAEYVYAKIVYDKLDAQIKKIKYVKLNERFDLEIYIDKKYVSFVAGPNKINRKKLCEKYNLNLKIKGV